MSENFRVRFMANNLAGLTLNDVQFSSELSGFPGTNAFNEFRSSLWKTSGHFLITLDSNDKIYINDGSDKTATITAGSYTSATDLCVAMATALNAVSSNWSCTYDTFGGTYKFTISRSSAAVLRLSVTSESIWDTIGFTSTINTASLTSHVANEQRNHTNEFITLDFGYLTPVTFIGIISDAAVFKLSAFIL